VLIIQGYDPIAVVLWFIAIFSLVYSNFINIILSNKDNLFAIFGAVAVSLAALHYYDYFNITDYTAPFF
jgi:uncharacterized membrane protein